MTIARRPDNQPRPLKADEWRVVDAALRDARLMVSRTGNRLAEIYNCLLRSSDPKRWTPSQQATVKLFKRHFKSDQAVEALQVQQAYRQILAALNAWQPSSFRVVNNAVARREGERDHYAYVRGDAPPIFMAESFFNEPAAERPRRASAKPPFPDATQRARLLIHATAHFKLGAGHRGGHFGFESSDCAVGYAVKSFEQAYDNACVYDFMAYCAGQQ